MPQQPDTIGVLQHLYTLQHRARTTNLDVLCLEDEWLGQQHPGHGHEGSEEEDELQHITAQEGQGSTQGDGDTKKAPPRR